MLSDCWVPCTETTQMQVMSKLELQIQGTRFMGTVSWICRELTTEVFDRKTSSV